MNQETEKAPWHMRLEQKQRRYMSNGFNGQKADSTIEIKVE